MFAGRWVGTVSILLLPFSVSDLMCIVLCSARSSCYVYQHVSLVYVCRCTTTMHNVLDLYNHCAISLSNTRSSTSPRITPSAIFPPCLRRHQQTSSFVHDTRAATLLSPRENHVDRCVTLAAATCSSACPQHFPPHNASSQAPVSHPLSSHVPMSLSIGTCRKL